MEGEKDKKLKAIVVGGSIAGLSCAHALITAGWEVTVIEKSMSPPAGSPTGAGLSLEPQARGVINQWLGDPSILHDITLPLTVELHQAVDNEKKRSRTLIRDYNFTYRCAHWTDLHSVIHKALPSVIILWGHHFRSLCISDDKASVKIEVKVLQTGEIKEMVAHLLIAADGSLSMIRQHFLPNHKLRYSGYSAWRGVFDFSEDESSDAIVGIKRAYPELGSCLYFDYVNGNHCVLFELRNKRLNWIWYFNTPEPDREGNSVTKKVSDGMIDGMQEEAKRIWNPELALLMRKTNQPFINLIYDSDPLPQLFWHNVVLVGDAAHPTTPHASRSTNMSILDAEVLGLCLEKRPGIENLPMALQEFQAIRHPVVSEQVLHSRLMGRLKQGFSEQVLHSRLMGRLKQGLPVSDNKAFDPSMANPDDCGVIQHKNIPFYDHVPISI